MIVVSGRARSRGRTRPDAGRAYGLTLVAVDSTGLAIGALAVVALIGCSSSPTGVTQRSAFAGDATSVPTVTPPGSAPPTSGPARGTSSTAPGRSGAHVDLVRVEKCWTTATRSHGGQLLVKASSSDPAAHLLVYGSDGSLIGEVQNGGGGRYGGSVMPYQRSDPGSCVVRSSAGGTSSAPSGPFQTGT